MVSDLREFIEAAGEMGESKLLEGAAWDREIGALGERYAQTGESPLLLFDRIPGYPPGYRVVSNLFTTPRRIALAMGLPVDARGIGLVKAWRDRIKRLGPPIPPVEVTAAPVKENVLEGDRVNLLGFPTPKWHERDGGRYIGTGCAVVMRDPDDGWVNLGTYRVQIQDRTTATIQIIAGQDGDIIQRKYWSRGLSCPAAVSCGQEPALFAAASWEKLPWGASEYGLAGALKAKPVEVTAGPFTGLPVPATAEIVLEGEIVPPEVETRMEGPFGEWAGYYVGGARPMPAFRVKTILHRNNPIIQGNPPSRLPAVWTLGRHIQKAASLWQQLDEQCPGIRGVWMIEDAAVHSIPVISLEQKYPGHAKQAALLAAGSSATGRTSRFIIVVDEDIDPSNLSEVWWALGTRTDPETTIDILRGCWGSHINPMLPREKVLSREWEHSRAIVLACKPYSRLKDFPADVRTDPDYLAEITRKWHIE